MNQQPHQPNDRIHEQTHVRFPIISQIQKIRESKESTIRSERTKRRKGHWLFDDCDGGVDESLHRCFLPLKPKNRILDNRLSETTPIYLEEKRQRRFFPCFWFCFFFFKFRRIHASPSHWLSSNVSSPSLSSASVDAWCRRGTRASSPAPAGLRCFLIPRALRGVGFLIIWLILTVFLMRYVIQFNYMNIKKLINSVSIRQTKI